MISISTQQEARKARNAVSQPRSGGKFDGFCYLCGGKLSDGRPLNRDHVPPRALFLPGDHEQLPLILQTHTKCNHDHHTQDEIIGQLAQALHGPGILQGTDKRGLILAPSTVNRSPSLLLPSAHLHLPRVIFQWVRGTHPLLYRSYLPEVRHRATHPPAPTATLLTDGTAMPAFVLPQEPVTVAMVRRNRHAGAIDRISAWNGKLTYECTWTPWSHGDGWLCFWGMRVYDWENLGDPSIHGRRGCSGVYLLREKPQGAAEALVRVTVDSTDTCLDPFEECA